MYQALYRKYRPKTLDEVVGQEVVIKILKNSLKNDKISHAYLFSGPRGTGKTSIAKILSRIINCSNPIDYSPCNKCVSCTQNNNIDIIEIDAASNNGVDEIRELKNKINLVPSFGKYKIYIIDEVHMLSIGAFNALLKTLEEPPAHAIFILATTEPHKIPVTILSRCQRLDFKRISEDAILDKLKDITKKEKIDVELDALKEISRLSDGGMRDAISMLDQAISYSDNKITLNDIYDINGIITKSKMNEFLNNLFEFKLSEILNLLDDYNNNGKNLVKLFEEIILHTKNILIYRYAPNYFKNKDEDVKEYKIISDEVGNNTLTFVIKEFSNILGELKYSNNPKLQIELTIINVINSLKLDSENKSKIIYFTKDEKEKTTENKVETEEVKVDEPIKEEVIKEKKSSNEQITIIKNDDLFEKFKEIRIGNTLSDFNKKYTITLKENLLSLKDKIYEFENKQLTSLLFDAEIKAASEKNIIFLFDDIKLASYFNNHIFEIEELLEKILQKKYEIIAVDKDLWNKIKKEFNSKTKKYEYISDKKIKEELLEKNKNENKDDNISNMFGDIVVYN